MPVSMKRRKRATPSASRQGAQGPKTTELQDVPATPSVAFLLLSANAYYQYVYMLALRCVPKHFYTGIRRSTSLLPGCKRDEINQTLLTHDRSEHRPPSQVGLHTDSSPDCFSTSISPASPPRILSALACPRARRGWSERGC